MNDLAVLRRDEINKAMDNTFRTLSNGHKGGAALSFRQTVPLKEEVRVGVSYKDFFVGVSSGSKSVVQELSIEIRLLD